MVNRAVNSLRARFLSRLVKEGVLERRFSDAPNHPAQAYRTAKTQTTPSAGGGKDSEPAQDALHVSEEKQAQRVREYVQAHGAVRRSDVMELCRVDGPQATRLLKRLVDGGFLERRGVRRGSHYVPGSKL